MKKSLIALAVAGAFAAPAMAASSNVDIYGKLRVSMDHINNGDGWSLNDETSRIGIKGAEDLGGGLKAIFQWESGLASGVTGAGTVGYNGSAAGGLGSQRNTFVGLSGGFGTALVGRHDTPYKMAGSADLFADTLADAQNGGALCVVCEDLRVSNAVAYVSPNFSGLTVAAAIVPGSAGAGTFSANNNLTDAYSLAGMYANGPLSVNLAYENLNNFTTPNDQNAWKITGGYTIGDIKLGATYEKINNVGGASSSDQKAFLLSAAYGMGPITLAAQYGQRDPSGTNNTFKDFTVGAVYSMSKRTSTYLGYAHYNKNQAISAGNSLNVLTLGLNHDF